MWECKIKHENVWLSVIRHNDKEVVLDKERRLKSEGHSTFVSFEDKFKLITNIQ